jgi:hypothetical protein
MRRTELLAKVVDWLYTNGLDEIEFSLGMYSSSRVDLTVYHGTLSADDRRKLKRACGGTMIVKGEPPYISLEGSAELGKAVIIVELYGAFECSISSSQELVVENAVDRDEVQKQITELLEQLETGVAKSITRKNTYNCKPKVSNEEAEES